MNALRRLECRIFGHAWSAWPQFRSPCAYCGKKAKRVRSLRTDWVDPIGWDETYGRVHDVEPAAGATGLLLHFSTCWCRHLPWDES